MGKRKRLAKLARKPQNQQNLASSIQIDRPETNSRIQLTSVFEFRPDDPRQQLPRTPFGSQGTYKVTFVLSIPGKNVFRDDLDFAKIMKSGESLLQTAPGINLKVEVSNDTTTVEILFMSNSQGQIATAQTRVQAQNFAEAEQIAYDLVAAQLSYWSFAYDVAIDIAGSEVVEEMVESTRYSFGILGKIKPFDKELGGRSEPTYRRFFSAYREGMNSTNPFYQALSFYKVAEGIKAERIRKARRSGTHQKGVTPMFGNELFPPHVDDLHLGDELSKASFAPYVGQGFLIVLEKLEELIRNAVAHLSQLDAVLDADRLNDLNISLRAVPVLRYIAREMLENELRESGLFPWTASSTQEA